MKRFSVIAILLIFILSIIWFNTQSVSVGYVHSMDDSRVWLIEFSENEIQGKTQDEILNQIESKAAESEGVFYDVPIINKALNTNFEKGEKVRIYWKGVVLQSAPAKVKDTLLMMKIN